jgi:hypothetical protein
MTYPGTQFTPHIKWQNRPRSNKTELALASPRWHLLPNRPPPGQSKPPYNLLISLDYTPYRRDINPYNRQS